MLSCILDFVDKLEPVDILRAGALVLFFVASVFSDRKRATWFQGETLALAIGGLVWILGPELLLEIQISGKPDVVHTYLGRIFGVALLSAAYSHGRNDKGENVNLARIIAGFVCSAGMIVNYTYGYFKYEKDANHLTLQFLTMGGLLGVLWCVGSMIMIYRECSGGTGENNYEDGDRQLVVHQLVDLAFIVLGMTHFVGCSSFLKDAVILESVKIDGVHLTLTRALGALFMYKFLVVLSTLTFQSEDPGVNAEQARDSFLSRILYILLGCGMAIWYQYTYHFVRTDHIVWSFALSALWGLNSWFGVKAADREING